MSQPQTKKRIIVLCDGSWQSRTQALVRNLRFRLSTQYIGNIALLAQAIKTEDEKGTPQTVYYQDGVGTTVGMLTNIFSGATGAGLSSNLIEAYSFIVDNYNPGDELFLFGFSRGAYTARALSGFLLWAGVMTKPQLSFIRPIYNAYQRRSPRNPEQNDVAAHVLHHFTGKWPSKEASLVEGAEVKKKAGKRTHDPARLEAQEKGPRAEPPAIKFIGVLDTVGALGVPGQFSTRWVRRFFDFFDTGLSSNVQNAYQALALGEDRADFAPTLWDSFDPKSGQTMKEIWFPGSHGDVGGGHPEHGASDVVLANLCAQLVDHPNGPLLALDLNHIKAVQDRQKPWGKQEPYRSRSWFQGRSARQVCRNLARKQADAAAAQGVPEPPSAQTPKWANEVPAGPNREMLHHSIVVGGYYDREHADQFKTLRERDPELLEQMWHRAEDPATLLPTERFLAWDVAEPDRVPPLSASWAQAPTRLSLRGVRRYLALKDSMMYVATGVQVWVRVATWPATVVLNTLTTRSLQRDNLSGKPPAHPGRTSKQAFAMAGRKLGEAIAGGTTDPPLAFTATTQAGEAAGAASAEETTAVQRQPRR